MLNDNPYTSVRDPRAEERRERWRLEELEAEQKRTAFRERAKGNPNEPLILELIALTGPNDPEGAHGDADDLLLKIIDDPLVTEVFNSIDKWYA